MARVILLALLLVPAVALADPISLVATLAPIFGSTVAGFIVSYGGYIAFGALQLAGAASARRKQRRAAAKQRAQYLASLQDRNVTVLSTEAPWQIAYGSPAPIGGALQAILTSGVNDEYQHLVIVFNRRPSEAIDEVYIEGEPVGALDANGWCTGGAFFEVGSDFTVTEEVLFDGSGVATVGHPVVSLLSVATVTGNPDAGYETTTYSATASGTTITAPTAAGNVAKVSYTYNSSAARVNIQKHLSPGGVDTADAFLRAACPDKWTAAHKASNTTYLVVTLDLRFGAFQGGPPNITAKGRWSILYDYRTSTSAYSANNALCAADFLTAEYGFGASSSQIDTAAVIAAANACDAQDFSCDGIVSTGSGRDANLQQIEDSMAGASHFSGGVWRIMAGAWTTPVMTLTDAYLAGPIEVVQGSNASAERYNTVRGQYAPAEGLGTVPDYTPYAPDAYLTADGKEKPLDLPLPMVGTNARCQKLAAIAVERSRLGETINYPAHLGAWKLQPGDRVYVTNAELGYSAKAFRVVDWTFSATSPVGLVMTEDAAAVYTGTFTNPDAIDTTSDLIDPFAKPPAPVNLAADSGNAVLQIGSDGTIGTRVLVTWSATTVRSTLQGGYTQLQWRLATATDDKWQSQDLPADADSQFLSEVLDGTALLIRVRHVSGLQVLGTWATISHTVLGKDALPSDVTGVAVTQDLVLWTPITDLDLAGYEVRAIPGSTGTWALGVALHNGLVTSTPYLYAQRLVGVQTVMVAARDTSGNYGLHGSATLDFGDIDESNVAQTYDYAAAGFPGPETTNATVSGTDLVGDADPATDWWSVGGEDWWGYAGGSDFYGGSLYLAMTYVASFAPDHTGGTIILDTTLLGVPTTIEWRTDGSILGDFWDSGGADLWDGTVGLYGDANAWAPYINGVTSVQGTSIQWRVTIGAGPVQGQITDMSVRLQMPQLSQVFTGLAIDAGGTRLTPASGSPSRTWISVEQVDFTVYVDGSGAVAGRVIDFDPDLGPLVQTINAAGSAVSSTGQAARVSGF